MKKIRLSIISALVLVVVMAFSGCAPTEKMLAAYDDDEIIGGNFDSYFVRDERMSVKDKVWDYSASSFSGVKQLAKITVEYDYPIMDLNVSINAGEFKLVLVNGDGEVYVLMDANHNISRRLDVFSGEYDFKIVGRHADISFIADFNFAYD